MKIAFCLLACASMAACATTNSNDEPDGNPDPQLSNRPGDEEATATDPRRSFSSGSVVIAAVATEGLDRIHRAAVALSTSACHGTTTCDGTVIGDWFTVDCGSPVCRSQGCGKGAGTALLQLREMYQPWARPDGTVCLLYKPAVPRSLGCQCLFEDP